MKWRRIKAFIIKDIKSVFRDKATVFWIFLWPLIWILMTAYVFVPPGVDSPITLDLGVINNDTSHSPFNGTTLIEVLDKVKYKKVKLFNIVVYNDTESLIDDLKRGRLDVGIVIPEGFGWNITYGQAYIKVLIGVEDPHSGQINSAIMRSLLQEFSRNIAMEKINHTLKYAVEYMPSNVTVPIDGKNITLKEYVKIFFIGIAEPVKAVIEEIKPEAFIDRSSIIGWFTIGAIGMMFLYGGFNWGALIIVEEKEKRTLKRLLSTPVSEMELLIGKTISGVIVLGLSALVALFTGVFLCGAKILWNPLNTMHWLVPLLLIMATLISIGIGIVLSMFTRTSRGANSLSVILGLMLAFTTGVWFPIEWFPSWMRFLAEVSPVTWAINAVRSIIVYNASLNEVAMDIVKVAVSVIVIYYISIIIYRKLIRKYAEE